MKDHSTVEREWAASRRAVLAGSLGAGLAAVAGAVLGAATGGAGETGGAGPAAGDGVTMAHGGAIHTQRHGGVTHTHDTVSHHHPVMAHGLDPRSLRAVDTATRGGPTPWAS